MEQGLTKQQILTELTKSAHSALDEYIPICRQAVGEDPEFFAHLISYDAAQLQIRDAHAALPVISLSVPKFTDPEYLENSLAHLAKLSPRELHAAYLFARGYVKNKELVANPSLDPKVVKRWPKVRVGGFKQFSKGFVGPQAHRMNMLDRLVARYLHSREDNYGEFERNVMNFRADMASLYKLAKVKPGDRARDILFNKMRPPNSRLEAIANLGRMDSKAAAAAIVEHRIPFLSLFPLLGAKAKDPVLLMTIIDRMSPSELQTNIAQLEKLGVKDYPETRAALEVSLEKLSVSKKTTLKTGRAVDKVTDEKLKVKLKDTQEKQISNLKGVGGNWLVLGDASSSMGVAVETAKLVAGTLCRFVKDQVALVFFNDSPRYFDVTGKTLEDIQTITRGVVASGWTSIGCGLKAAMDRKLDIDGIAVISDGGENRLPMFAQEYARLCKLSGKDVPVYYYKVGSATWEDTFVGSMAKSGYGLETFDLRNVKVDEYSLPNFVNLMKVNRYGILDAVMESKLITIDSVLGVSKKGELVLTV